MIVIVLYYRPQFNTDLFQDTQEYLYTKKSVIKIKWNYTGGLSKLKSGIISGGSGLIKNGEGCAF